jgi:hypothetical protein
VHLLLDDHQLVDINEFAEYRAAGSPSLRKRVNPAGRGVPHARRTAALVPLLVHISKNPDALLSVTTRTLRREVDRLRGLGYPVEASGGIAGYRLGVRATLPPLLLDDYEAVAVALGLRTAANGTIAGIEETVVRALAKLEQLLPSRLRHRVTRSARSPSRCAAAQPSTPRC